MEWMGVYYDFPYNLIMWAFAGNPSECGVKG